MTPSVFPILSLVLTGGESPAKLRDYADPFLDLLNDYGSPWSMEERTPASR